jgi:hypothetical protein
MSEANSRRALQAFLFVLGGVALVAGAATVLFGAELVANAGDVTPDVDSEMRFYAVWYAAAGVMILRAIPHAETEGRIVKWVGAAFFLAGCARILSIMAVAKPSALYIVLMVAELVLPIVIIPWQSSVAKAAARRAEQPDE